MGLARRNIMPKKPQGLVSQSLFSLQLQLKTLLEGAGGEDSIEFLDSLSELTNSEQKIVLRVFNRVVEKIRTGDSRLNTEEDQELKAFEENLYNDIISSFEQTTTANGKLHLEVLDGGKSSNLLNEESGPQSQCDIRPFPTN